MLQLDEKDNRSVTHSSAIPFFYQMQNAIARRTPITAEIPVRMMPTIDESPLVLGGTTGVPATDTGESNGFVIGEPKGVLEGLTLGDLEGLFVINHDISTYSSHAKWHELSPLWQRTASYNRRQKTSRGSSRNCSAIDDALFTRNA